MGFFVVSRRATFALRKGVEASELLDLVKTRVAWLDPATIVEDPSAVEFDVGPLLLRIDMWFRPFNQLRGVSRGRVEINVRESRALVSYDLHLDRSAPGLFLLLVLGMNTAASMAPSMDGMDHVGHWGVSVAVLALVLMAARLVVSVRFGSLVERSLEPCATPIDERTAARG